MIILYPTETVYALGVSAFDEAAVASLYALKAREEGKSMSVLVRDMEDVCRYAQVSQKAHALAERYLPGPLTLVLKAIDLVPRSLLAPDGTLAFRISSDPYAQALIAEHMAMHVSPLTCTSANVSGLPTLPTVPDILAQFNEAASAITRCIDGGARVATPSTIVRVVDDTISILRDGAIPRAEILSLS